MGKQTKQEATGFFPVLIGHSGPRPSGRESELFQKKETKSWMGYLK